MKQLNEYKAEIFRRSKEVINQRAERKKRTRKLLFSVCVPLCLVLVVCSVTFLPGLISPEEHHIEKYDTADAKIDNTDESDGADMGESEDTARDGDGMPPIIDENNESFEIAPENTTDDYSGCPVDFTAEYIRTGSYIEENYYPIINIIDSYERLNEYYEENKDTYYLGRRDNSYDDSTTGFLDACDGYTEEFFEEKSLIFVILEEPSGSIRHKVEYVNASEGSIDIGIDPIVPEAGTDDMAIWHIIIAVDKDVIPETEDEVNIFYKGKETNREYFDFFIRWNTYGISSYDSRTGLLIKTDDATRPEEYITCCYLPEEQMMNIRNIIEELNIESYPDEYNPHGETVSTPYMTLELTVCTERYTKTVSVPETALSYETDDPKGQSFLDAFGAIVDIITHTDEWSKLPDYEFYYD